MPAASSSAVEELEVEEEDKEPEANAGSMYTHID
jgi:hypothetical protein